MPQKEIAVGIGEIKVSSDSSSYLISYSLGSCIAVIIYDTINSTAGMAHIALSDSMINIEKAGRRPGYYADTGIKELLLAMRENGVTIDPKKLIVKIAGGAKTLKLKSDRFKIAENNIQTVRKLLKEAGLNITGEDVGDTIPRTVRIETSTGKVTVSNWHKGSWEL